MRCKHLMAALLLGGTWLAQSALAYTEIEGEISGTLSFADSPYLMTNTITVTETDTLIIEAGVEIFVADINQQVTLIVDGALIVESTPDSMITFLAYFPEDPADITWNGIMYFQSGTVDPDSTDLTLQHVWIENAFFGIRVILRSGQIAIQHNVIANCNFGACLINTSNAWLYHNTIVGLDPAGYALAFSNYHIEPEQFTLENNIITEATLGMYFFWSDYEVDDENITIDYNCFYVDSLAAYFYNPEMPFDTLNNIFADPEFVEGTFYLSENSPCIDAGNPDYPWDPDGSPPDMGAFPFDLEPVRDPAVTAPAAFTLYPAYPNPFNPATTIRFQLPYPASVNLSIHNLVGQRVAVLLSGFVPAGEQSVVFKAVDLPGGLYFYRLTDDRGAQAVGKMVLLK